MQECPLCKTTYTQEQKVVLDADDEMELTHTTCQECHVKIMSLIIRSAIGMSTVAMLSDCTTEDLLRVHHIEPLSDNDVLEFHQYLQSDTALVEEVAHANV